VILEDWIQFRCAGVTAAVIRRLRQALASSDYMFHSYQANMISNRMTHSAMLFVHRANPCPIICSVGSPWPPKCYVHKTNILTKSISIYLILTNQLRINYANTKQNAIKLTPAKTVFNMIIVEYMMNYGRLYVDSLHKCKSIYQTKSVTLSIIQANIQN
jgi:hypothetical protein